MVAWRRIWQLGLSAAASVVCLTGTAALADYENALKTYLRATDSENPGSIVVGAIDLWEKSALAGDVRSARILGDLYWRDDLLKGRDDDLAPEETGVVSRDPVKALSWYILAATHDFSAYQQKDPLPSELAARTMAERALPELRRSMSDAAVAAAEERVEQLLGGGSAFDLLRLGQMRAAGHGLSKNNVEALKYLYLARGRGRGANADAAELIERLEEVMVRRDVQMASRLSDGWQPPLPETYALLTENERNDAQRLTQLQYQELRDNLERLEKEFRGGDRVTSEALKALGYFYDTRGDGKLDATDRDLAVKRFQRSLFAEGRPADRIGEPLSEEEEALANDIATGDLTDLQTVELMRQAAMRGHAPSQHIYGVMLGRGIGVRKNGREAMEMLLAAAEQDYALAHYSAGIFYIEGITATESLRPSKREACFHLRSAAVLDYAKAEDAQRDYCK